MVMRPLHYEQSCPPAIVGFGLQSGKRLELEDNSYFFISYVQ
jgi:hypothetical protein